MKKKIVGILVTTLLIATALHTVGAMNEVEDRNILSVGGPDIEWEFITGGPYQDTITAVYETEDGGFIAAGTTEDPEDVFSGWVIKLDKWGNEEWRTIETEIQGPSVYDFGITGVCQTHDGGYIVSAACKRLEDLQYGFLWKLAANGETEWFNSAYTGEYMNKWYVILPWDILPVVNGYIVTGAAWYLGDDYLFDVDAFLMKTDLNGDVVWQQIYRYGEHHDEGRAFCPTPDGGYLIVGNVNTILYGVPSPVDGDIWLIKTDAEGNLEWEKTYGGPSDEWIMTKDIFQTSDGGFIANSMTSSYGVIGSSKWNVCLQKFDEDGNELWNRTYGKANQGDTSWSMDTTSDGGFVFAAAKNHNGFMAPKDSMWLVKTDGNGNVEWSQTYGGDKTDRAYGVQQTSDDGYIMSGATASYGAGEWDGCIIKYPAFENQRPNNPTCKYDRNTDELVVSATDSDGDQIRYSVDWENDGIIDQWTELLDSGVEVRIDCEEKTGPFEVMAEDEHGGQSDCISVKSKNKPYINAPFIRFLEQHPNLFPNLRQLLELN